jgi:NADPH-dependent 2,4-dienoyl-CoA reductase/sulfur reductase-like enzyme/Fe-S-cluster-containing hydrogenase component 2/bacterioferritin-associated ferredoxin
MHEYRIEKHPILSIPDCEKITFFWQGQEIEARAGETIASALFASGIRVFGHHHKDGAPQGIFCANGQCAQCMVIADGLPLKSCAELAAPGMRVEPADGLPALPEVEHAPGYHEIPEIATPVLILGGGPSGMSAAIELGKLGIHCILVDDKHRLGGKLVLQTHRFFGSSDAVYAGTRGINIATRLEKEVASYPSVEIWLHSTALAVFSDKKIGILKGGKEYVTVLPEVILAATGARERFLAFRGNTLPGVYGAGAFQTLVNRDLIRPAEKLFIVGGGNVGLIAGYHALQAGIEVVGLVEALPECGGYKVHKDKLARMGVPIYTSHTVLSANGDDKVESVTIAKVDERFRPIPGTEKSFACDSVLIAVGLEPVDEFYRKAKDFGINAFSAGDAEEIAEASAAMFSGKIKGLEIARALGVDVGEIPAEWYRTGEILKSKPGPVVVEEAAPMEAKGVLPVFHCTQDIPCNPCSSVCSKGLIFIDPNDIRSTPVFKGDATVCIGCEKCLAICPGLAITLVDYRKTPETPIVAIPFEFNYEMIKERETVTVLDTEGGVLGDLQVVKVEQVASRDHTIIVKVKAPREVAARIAGIRIQEEQVTQPMNNYVDHISDDTIICRCERVTAGEIRQLIRQGYRDLNEIKAITRAAMGACGSKTCHSLIFRLFRDEGIILSDITDTTRRPIFIEAPLSVFAGADGVDSAQAKEG